MRAVDCFKWRSPDAPPDFHDLVFARLAAGLDRKDRVLRGQLVNRDLYAQTQFGWRVIAANVEEWAPALSEDATTPGDRKRVA